MKDLKILRHLERLLQIYSEGASTREFPNDAAKRRTRHALPGAQQGGFAIHWAMLKVLRAAFLAWLLPLGLAFVATGIIAGSTSRLGASAVGPWMMGTMGLQLLFFAAGSRWLWGRLGLELTGGSRIGVFVLHSLVQAGLAVTLVFATLVLFNR